MIVKISNPCYNNKNIQKVGGLSCETHKGMGRSRIKAGGTAGTAPAAGGRIRFLHGGTRWKHGICPKNCAAEVFSNPVGMGVLSKNPLQNIKYHFVITASLVTRYCVTGGMEAEQAYRLSDFYILRADACTDVASVVALHHAMVLDYTGKMALRKKADIVSQPVSRCVDYIYDHINERITVQTLSEYTGLSVSYLSRVFKQNLGISISDYIREKKIEKAQNLLRYSDASLIDIANYLAFSSQSHFIQVFESLVGVSPKKYRDKYFNSMW